MNTIRIDHRTEGAIHRLLLLIADRYDIAGAILYGSRARNTHRPDSDADVAVLLKGEHQAVLETALAMADVAYDVLLETGINITRCRFGLMNGSTRRLTRTPHCCATSPRKG